MAYDPYGDSMTGAVLSADPLELVVMLYNGLLASIRDARGALASGDRAARARAAGRGMEILLELSSSLDRERGGELAGQLARLYAFMLERLQDGNFRQQDAPFAEAEAVALPLLEAWRSIRTEGVEVVMPLPGYSPAAAPSISLCG